MHSVFIYNNFYIIYKAIFWFLELSWWVNIIDWFSFVFAIFFQIYLFRKGQIFNKIIINISAIFVYIGLILFCAIIASTNLVDVANSFKDLLVFDNVISKSNISPFLTVFGTMFAYFSIVIVNFGDFSRSLLWNLADCSRSLLLRYFADFRESAEAADGSFSLLTLTFPILLFYLNLLPTFWS